MSRSDLGLVVFCRRKSASRDGAECFHSALFTDETYWVMVTVKVAVCVTEPLVAVTVTV